MSSTGNNDRKKEQSRWEDIFTLMGLSSPSKKKRPPAPPQNNLYDLLNHTSENNCTANAIVDAIRRDPNAAKTKYEFPPCGRHYLYPLTRAVAIQAPKSVIQVLYDANPDAIQDRDSSLQTPLHWACFSRAPSEVILFLIDKFPAALEMKDKLGRTPLHRACQGRLANWEDVRTLVKLNPAALEITDNIGRTPLHWACRHGAPVEVVRVVAEHYPAALDIEDEYGYDPTRLSTCMPAMDNDEIFTLLTTLRTLLCFNPSDDEVGVILRETGMGMWHCKVAPILCWRTSVVQRMDISSALMTKVLSMVSQEGKVQIIYEIVRDNMAFLKV